VPEGKSVPSTTTRGTSAARGGCCPSRPRKAAHPIAIGRKRGAGNGPRQAASPRFPSFRSSFPALPAGPERGAHHLVRRSQSSRWASAWPQPGWPTPLGGNTLGRRRSGGQDTWRRDRPGRPARATRERRARPPPRPTNPPTRSSHLGSDEPAGEEEPDPRRRAGRERLQITDDPPVRADPYLRRTSSSGPLSHACAAHGRVWRARRGAPPLTSSYLRFSQVQKEAEANTIKPRGPRSPKERGPCSGCSGCPGP